MEDLRLDSHKLIFHPLAVGNWLQNMDTYPINCEIGISGTCNHRCTFCSIDYMGYKPMMIDSNVLIDNFALMHEKGLKSVVFAGNGEPLLHKEAVNIINKTKKIGIDAALSTNGVYLDKEKSQECLGSLTWLRFSTSAATEKIYNKIHQGHELDLDKVFTNIANAAEIKRLNSYSVTIGVQIVLIQDNYNEAVALGKKVKELGADYYTVKSFGEHMLSGSELRTSLYGTDFYSKINDIEQELIALEDDKFKVYIRKNRMNKINCKRTYDECHALPFFSVIDANGDVWPCCIYIGADDMSYGNIYQHNFVEIWESEQRKKVIDKINSTGLAKCSAECRLDEMNRYLNEVKNPNLHSNFV